MALRLAGRVDCTSVRIEGGVRGRVAAAGQEQTQQKLLEAGQRLGASLLGRRGEWRRDGRRRGVFDGGVRHAIGLSVWLGACGDGVGDVASGCGVGGGGASSTAACGT